MTIDLANVVPRPKAIEIGFTPNEIDLDIDGTQLVRDVLFRGETERVDEKAHVRGTISTEVSVDCTRCLEPIDTKLEISFDAVFVETADEHGEIETALVAEQLDESVAEEGRIDLAEVVREQILLGLSEHKYCRDDCRGLCPKCGGNRNLIDCKCEENEIDPRWAALKDIN